MNKPAPLLAEDAPSNAQDGTATPGEGSVQVERVSRSAWTRADPALGAVCAVEPVPQNPRHGARATPFGMLLAGMIGASLSAATPSSADTTDELLDQLKAKGILTKAEYHKLKARHAAEIAQRTAPPPPKRRAAREEVAAARSDRYITPLDKGIGAHVGPVDVKLSGQLVFFGAEQFKQQGTGIVAGGLGGGSSVNNSNAIRSGLLPSALVLDLATRQMGYDIGFTLGLYLGGNNINVGLLNANSGGSAVALGTPGIDARQIFGTISTPTMGTIKVGRDIGLFGSDAIINDFTLFGAGTIAGNASPSNTSLGRIGFGYVYADWIPQVTYTTPDLNGFTASVGVFSPYEEFNASGLSGTLSAHDQPGIQGRLKYVGTLAPDLKLTAWTDALTQQHRAEVGDAVFLAPGTNIRAWAVDGGMRLDWGPVTLVGYGYYGVGLGTTGLYFDGVSIDGIKRKSSGFYAQGSYTFFERLTIGGSYGVSYLKANWIDYQPLYGNGTLVASNASTIAFASYKFTDWVSFQGEWIHSLSRNQLGDGVSTDAFVLGTIFFF